jgi:regulator of replication initiation timing
VANENKDGKAGETTPPATPSKVEGTQESNKIDSVNQEDLNTSLAAKDAEIDKLKAEHQEFKDKLKPEIEKITEENKALKAEHQEFKDKLKPEIEKITEENKALKAEHQEFKDKLKPEIEKITEENKALKADNAKLKAALDKATAKSKAKKGDPKFIVINAFRGTKDGEGIFELESDVSHLDADRLDSLVERGLVKKV